MSPYCGRLLVCNADIADRQLMYARGSFNLVKLVANTSELTIASQTNSTFLAKWCFSLGIVRYRLPLPSRGLLLEELTPFFFFW